MKRSVVKKAATNHPQKIYQPFDVIMEEAGFDALYTVIEQMGGATIYIPTMRTVFQDCLVAEARREFRGQNLASIARKYGFSERGMRKIFERED
ncbi:MAG: hypothetical protein FWF77_06560 [Defluviitaleaceae bacterium]|nr:hypothetical protein [Defluviitaleaceae bacterium]